MRGKVSMQMLQKKNLRITPAYAGKSVDLIVAKLRAGDHPRLCGEKEVKIDEKVQSAGITPAYAGKSWNV